jgi:hypothetical protein
MRAIEANDVIFLTESVRLTIEWGAICKLGCRYSTGEQNRNQAPLNHTKKPANDIHSSACAAGVGSKLFLSRVIRVWMESKI